MNELLDNREMLIDRVRSVLGTDCLENDHFASASALSPQSSAVLFLLGTTRDGESGRREPCLILNKRSESVPQPGDLCCPGGGIDERLDPWLARALRLPGSPLRRCPGWRRLHRRRPAASRRMSLLLATSLRESFEEMRLNPLRVDFLGSLPPQRLVSFQRVIYPMVCWHRGSAAFRPNWEVQRIVAVPIRSLLDRANYATYRLTFRRDGDGGTGETMDHICMLHGEGKTGERLWGATFRITMAFLEMVFGFRPPGMANLPVVHKTLDETYFTGNGPRRKP